MRNRYDPDLSLEEEELWQDEEMVSEQEYGDDPPEDEEPQEEDGEKKRKSLSRLPLILLAACAVFLLCLYPWQGKRTRTPETERNEPSAQFVSVTEAGTKEAQEKPEETETVKETSLQTETAPVRETVDKAPDLSWQDTIFGKGNASVIPSPIRVSGLTENEKNLTGFRESDFIRSLSGFLASNGIRTGAVTFSAPIACSASGAAAYTAALSGTDAYRLIALFFPEYPGKYLFALEDVKTVETRGSAPAQTERKTTPVPASAVQVPVPAARAQSETEESADAYNAMDLSIDALPQELSNYLANPYELQYSLYDYLYRHGVKNVRHASVTDYYIDDTTREAVIQLSADGGNRITAIYDRDGDTYEFR